MTRLFVSPHLDDVALSCAGRLLRARDAGDRVVVATVFSAGGPAHGARQEEDRAALASIGAEAVHLGFSDGPWRPGIELSYRSLVLEAAVDAALVAAVADAVSGLVRALGPRETYLPLGVGGHIDHRTVCAAAAGVAGPVAFYEDRPYAFADVFVRLRLHELGAAAVDGDPEGPLGAAFASRPHLRGYVPLEDERAFAIRAHARRAAFRARLPLLAETLAFSEDELARAVTLVTRYRSQCRELFGAEDAAGIARVYRGPATGAFVERIYRPAPERSL
jgi:LmbE family N-acetylglucosaminyl deacetylase